MTHILNSVGLTNITDTSDVTKTIAVSLSGATTGTSTTFSLAQTANRTITFPNVTTTMVGTDATQALTNKTITDVTNAVTATGLRTATTTVAVSPATAPSANQALVATSSTAATWQTLSSAIFANSGVGAGTYNFPVSITVNAAGIITAATSNQNLIPNVDAASNLGSTSLKWANILTYNALVGFNQPLEILSRVSTIMASSDDTVEAMSCYTTADQYPCLSIRTFNHNANAILFDSYNGSGTWRSSSSTSNFSIQKTTNIEFWNANGVSAGGAITWNIATAIDPRGVYLAQKYASMNSTVQTGTASQSAFTVTASSGFPFTAAMVGGIIVWNTAYAFIVNFTSTTVITVDTSQGVVSAAFTLYYGAFQTSRRNANINDKLYLGPGQAMNTPTRLSITGTAIDQVNGPHFRTYLSTDAFSAYELLTFSHDNIAGSYDAFYNGNNWISSFATSNFQLYKVSDTLQINYANSVPQGNVVTWNTGWKMSNAGLISNMKLLTTGGTAATFDYYEETTLSDTTAGTFAVAITLRIIRIGGIVMVKFPSSTATATATSVLFLTSAGTFPARFRPPALTSYILPVTNNGARTNGDLTWDPSILRWFVTNVNNTTFTTGTCGYFGDFSVCYSFQV